MKIKRDLFGKFGTLALKFSFVFLWSELVLRYI